MSSTERWIELATELRRTELGRESDWLKRWRGVATDRLADLGWFGTRAENWRYFDLRPLAKWAPQRAATTASTAEVEALLARHSLPREALKVVFVDGRFAPELSSDGEVLAAAGVRPLSDALVHDADLVSERLGLRAPFDDHSVTAWNAATFSDGLWLDLPRGVSLESILCVARIHTAPAPHAVSATRNILHLHPESSARLLELDVGLTKGPGLTSTVNEITVGSGARLERLRLQDAPAGAWQIASTHLKQAGQSATNSHLLNSGASASRDEVEIELSEPKARCRFDGLFPLDGDQVADHHTRVHHQAPHCTSDEAYKGILGGRSRGGFTGRIVVAAGAQKTDAYQNNANLLLSEHAQINTRPQLEIYADDVRCTHGATTGQLDENQLLYLRSRGLDAQQATELLTMAFGRELLERIEDDGLREFMELALDRRRQGETVLETAS